MAYDTFVQGALPADVAGASTPSLIPDHLLPVGILGGDVQYAMPKSVLDALAGHLGGMVINDLPPFLVACVDGLILVLTLSVGEEFMGAAFVLPPPSLSSIDRHLSELWQHGGKEQTVEEFFQGTVFCCGGNSVTTLPHAIEEDWHTLLC